jgi:DNA-binding transcriptional MerR regulator
MTTAVAGRTADGQTLVKIGPLAERVGLSLRSVRYYEEVGLLTPTARSAGGFRLYGPEHETRLMLIKQMKPLGFSLHQMRDLLDTLDAASSANPLGEAVSGLAEELDREIVEVAARRADLARQLDAAHALESSLRAVANDLLGGPVRV